MQDWHTVAEVEAILNHLSQFYLDERRVLPAGTVASSFAMLFRRLLSVTINSLSFKCYALDEATTTSECSKVSVRRKAKSVDSFTSSGSHFLVQLRQLISLKFPSPSSTSAIDYEIKAMLLDPRISCESRGSSHRYPSFSSCDRSVKNIVLLLCAACPIVEEEVDEEDDDEEFRALLMVDGAHSMSHDIVGGRSRGVGAQLLVVLPIVMQEAALFCSLRSLSHPLCFFLRCKAQERGAKC
ncbi:hypothetical protein PsorP6_019143 [Peronosclerospora sorghi]|nr:hypothetical protein PsorP6_019143 [Peronosclerospora sorghi]